MAFLPQHKPKKMSLGPLEKEVLEIVWQGKVVTVKNVHDRILQDPNRELAYTSVTTVLRRLTEKGWLKCSKKGRAFSWQAIVSQEQAQAWQSYEKLNGFLAVSNPDVVASFADSLDAASIEQIDAIAARLNAIRRQREEER
ncbi:BlaI/MecI/CopY family transcriptional regulator [Waterburya agarophytonicola K14]|uniref:BlaI/MecI/CopY family transcriptional regulator n=1 Tax=Waterburya agarophytonicola KI4 TaxID=2874699 RepID=A0A964BRS6_9CYAN|nr:BlaI/MecI/CopY family transcriptional regulator [Waterburya agarophytonicola]MCC0176645.1 BlaI/MecI/CopY family transcriptional regulator [Waterburya agarophytonicola KI4]